MAVVHREEDVEEEEEREETMGVMNAMMGWDGCGGDGKVELKWEIRKNIIFNEGKK